MTTTWPLDPAMLRLGIVLTLLVLLLIGQHLWPRRGDLQAPRRRWRNLGLAALGTLLVVVVMPLSAVEWAQVVRSRGLGMLPATHWPMLAQAIIAVILLDMAIYWQHRLSHRLPWLWRLHQVHHSDLQVDVTLGVRFHPGEILLSMLYKFAVIVLLGATPLAVAVYEILLASFALLTHADIALPVRWDRRLRLLLVTPDWHRVHHSVHRAETDSNYGNLLTLWDHVFASQVAQPRDGHLGMRIGLNQFREPAQQTLPQLLRMPLGSPAHDPPEQHDHRNPT
jgi:sterol desaturase/sphingolipid hydroxylase (fatty acid hydroxylase superfamily)